MVFPVPQSCFQVGPFSTKFMNPFLFYVYDPRSLLKSLRQCQNFYYVGISIKCNSNNSNNSVCDALRE